MNPEFERIYNYFGGDIVAPLYYKLKFPKIKNWETKYFSLSSFEKASGICIRINKCEDIVCLDLDLKGEEITPDKKLKVEEKLFEFIGINGVYIEKTLSGSYHLFFKIKKEELKYLHDNYSTDDRHVAFDSELFPNKHSSTRQIAIAPTVATDTDKITKKKFEGNYVKLYGDLTKLDYVDVDSIEKFIKKLINILGVHSTKKTIVTKNNEVIHLDIDKDYEKFKKETKSDVKSNLIKLQKLLKENNLIEHYLEHLGLNYRVVDNKKINLYSMITDDGANPDAYVFTDKLVYWDFHNNKGYNFVYITYILFEEKVLNFLSIHDFIKKEEVECDDVCRDVDKHKIIDDVKDKLLEGKKLLISSTGSGKTHTIKQLAKEGNKIIMIEPLTVQVLQEDKNIESYISCFCEGSKHKEIRDNTNLIFCTYDKLREVIGLIDLNEWKLVIDEAHELICALSYRRKVLNFLWNIIKNRKQYLFMTATNNLLFLEDFVDETYIIESKKKKNRFFYNIKTNKVINQIVDNVINLYPNEVVQFVYIDSKKNLKKIYNNLMELGVKYEDITIVNSTNKITDARDIIEGMKTTKKIYLTTRVLSAGFHIMSKETFIYHIVPNDINVMIQETNRVRENEENTVLLYIYHNVRKKHMDIDYDKEWSILYKIKKKFIDKINEEINNTNNGGDKEYLENNWNLLHATKNDYWIRYLVYSQLCPIASRDINYIIKTLVKEGFEDVSTKVFSTDLCLEEIEVITDYDVFFDEFMKDEIKISPTENNKMKVEIYYITQKIKKYREVFKEDDINNYKNKIKEGKISNVKSSISQKINLYAIENVEVVGKKTKAIMNTKIKELFELLKDKKSIGKSVLEKKCRNLNINKAEMSVILKKLGFVYNKNKKRYFKE